MCTLNKCCKQIVGIYKQDISLLENDSFFKNNSLRCIYILIFQKISVIVKFFLIFGMLPIS